MNDISELFSTSPTLSIVAGKKQTELACGFCKSAFIMDVDFYISETENNQPVCLLCAAELLSPDSRHADSLEHASVTPPRERSSEL